jgi:glycosyltransferase involved in cell wall biosynthesis
MKVAIYTIALNEAQFIKRWYESAKDADYLLIADTGSTDETYDIAEELGIAVVSIKVMPWRFDLARNAALTMLPEDMDYCIALDMDEVLVGSWKEELAKAKEKEITRPRYKYTWSWKDSEEKIPGLQYGGDKVHTRSGYRWKHPVHEVLISDRVQETQGWFDFEIHHHPDHSKSRSQYLPLLELAVQEDPWDDRNAYYYARELFFNQKYLEAFREFKRYLTLPTAKWNAERSAALRYMAKCLGGPEREKYLKLALKESPKRREPLVDLALFYFDNNNWKDCLRYAKEATKIEEKPLEYLCEEFAWGSIPYDLVAVSSYRLEYYKQALLFGKKAVKMSPNSERLLENLKLYEAAVKENKE